MGETITTDRDVEIRTFTNHEPANGDPIIIVPIESEYSCLPITLGTGFHGLDDLSGQIEYANRTGNPTADIPPAKAVEIHESSASEFDVFFSGARIKTPESE